MNVDNLGGKSIVITGAASGFGRLVATKAAARGAKVMLGDIDGLGVEAVAAELRSVGGAAQGLRTDVGELSDMKALVQASIEHHGGVDVMLNNAGIMPLAFFADHGKAHEAWSRCIDVNIKGVLNGMIAAYDPMVTTGRGHVVNISSIYGNFPVAGAGVYGATKAAVNFLSESLRVEAHGKIKVTVFRPTGVPGTGLGGAVVNPEASIGIFGQNLSEFRDRLGRTSEERELQGHQDVDSTSYSPISPEQIADAIILVIDQPWGISVSDITLRATNDCFIL